MTAEPLTHPLGQAIADLDWCAQPPHDIDAVVGIYSEELDRNGRGTGRTMTNEEIMSAITSHAGGGGKGGHSDPTPQAALAGHDDADETLGTIDGAIATITDEVSALAAHFAVAPPKPARSRSQKARECVTTLHRIDATDLASTDRLTITAITETASWLRVKLEGIWMASKGWEVTPAVQRQIVECRICGGWHRGTIAVAAGRCLDCKRFYDNHGCERIEGIVRRADYGKGPTPAQMVEARAAKRTKERAS